MVVKEDLNQDLAFVFVTKAVILRSLISSCFERDSMGVDGLTKKVVLIGGQEASFKVS